MSNTTNINKTFTPQPCSLCLEESKLKKHLYKSRHELLCHAKLVHNGIDILALNAARLFGQGNTWRFQG
ncbi:MAG: hypothetical protein NPMRTHETA2_490005 [Nitrosopumilales archaeon]|nr:MAG: hypothetical protein NPMRTHETA2_490005 [Nitrosopumilales archaeon]